MYISYHLFQKQSYKQEIVLPFTSSLDPFVVMRSLLPFFGMLCFRKFSVYSLDITCACKKHHQGKKARPLTKHLKSTQVFLYHKWFLFSVFCSKLTYPKKQPKIVIISSNIMSVLNVTWSNSASFFIFLVVN